MKNDYRYSAGLLLKLLRPIPNINCDDAFVEFNRSHDGSLCLRIRNGDGLDKTAPELAVLIQLLEIEKITQGEWARPLIKFKYGIWRLEHNVFIREWLHSKFPQHQALIDAEAGHG